MALSRSYYLKAPSGNPRASLYRYISGTPDHPVSLPGELTTRGGGGLEGELLIADVNYG